MGIRLSKSLCPPTLLDYRSQQPCERIIRVGGKPDHSIVEYDYVFPKGQFPNTHH